MIRSRLSNAPGTLRGRDRTRSALPFLALSLALGLGACATRPDPRDAEAVAEFRANNDPLEPLNRGAFFVNEGLDTLVLRPAAEMYRIFLPPEVRTAIRNVLANLRTPVILANDLLQGETQRAATTTGRFLVNTTIGIGGIFDRAKDFGLIGHTEDFGQTLAVWGAPEGPYLFIPVLGPSSPRDVVGFAGDVAMNPLTYTGNAETWEAINITRTTTTALDAREGLIEPLDQVRATSLDPYATIRSAYRQRRLVEIRNAPTGAAATSDSGLGSGIQGLRR
ncbi:MlaA family lipoprotein [Falsiroseomonas tokyonensis]|uniref:VacJ family lipoprotein n=1 Tax=Falsiroseomonas tokyonensis TaxID=430521 RepID=A0ABV7BLK0_9PROT|nr:VacJ family lipoprotein [Falsiroseomonas tokyonensis]